MLHFVVGAAIVRMVLVVFAVVSRLMFRGQPLLVSCGNLNQNSCDGCDNRLFKYLIQRCGIPLGGMSFEQPRSCFSSKWRRQFSRESGMTVLHAEEAVALGMAAVALRARQVVGTGSFLLVVVLFLLAAACFCAGSCYCWLLVLSAGGMVLQSPSARTHLHIPLLCLVVSAAPSFVDTGVRYSRAFF
jgi:hypothetical protein